MTKTAPLWSFSDESVMTGLGLPGSHKEVTWPRYIRITDMAGPTSLREDVFASQPPEIASRADVRENDILFAAVGATVGKSVRIGRIGDACFAGYLARVRPRTETESRYLAYWAQSLDFWSQIQVGTVKTTIENFSAGRYRQLRVPWHDLDTQREIADYLDRETGEIDAMIAKMDELAETLLARRKTLILRGTRQDGLSVDSAADAAETATLPDGWRLLPLKFAIEDAQTGVWGEESNGGDDDILCARVADFDRVKINVTEVPTVRRVSAKDREKCALRHGDILVEKSGGTDKNPVGTVVAYEGELPAVYANFILRLRPLEDHHARFWLYALHGSYLAGRTWNFVRQTTGIQNLDVNGYLSMPHPVPAHDEQRRIADHLDEVTGKIDTMLAKVAELKSLLIERRAALITDVVTGRKAVA